GFLVDGSRGASRLLYFYMRRGAPRDAGTSDGQVLGPGSLLPYSPVGSGEGLPWVIPRPRAHGGRLPRTRLSRRPAFVAHSVRAAGISAVMARVGGGGDKWDGERTGQSAIVANSE